MRVLALLLCAACATVPLRDDGDELRDATPRGISLLNQMALGAMPGAGLSSGSFSASLLSAGATGSDLTLSGTLALPDGNSTTPSLTFINATGAGMYRSNTGYALKGGLGTVLSDNATGISLNWNNVAAIGLASSGIVLNSAGQTVSSNTTIASSIASGSNAFSVGTNGARVDFGAGASDYASSDGTTVTFAGPITSGSTITSGAHMILTAASAQLRIGSTVVVAQNTAPTISSGFGTGAAITGTQTAAFLVNVGTGGVATSGVIGLPSANSWTCKCEDVTTQSATVFITKQTASSGTTCTVGNFNTAGAAAAWVASDVLYCMAMGR